MTLAQIGRIMLPMMIAVLLQASPAAAQQNNNVARIVVWQPRPGMVRDFEEGYKRHLEWHRSVHDTWAWRGWTISSGDRVDYFADGTFFHAWADFDSPVSPAGDSANNDLNVQPYADVRALATYEAIPALSNLQQQQLSSPLLTFCYLAVAPGRGEEFESLVADALRNPQDSAVVHAVLRPADGATEYLMLLPVAKTSELGAQADFIARLLQALARKTKDAPIVARYRTETGHYRADLSNIPGGK